MIIVNGLQLLTIITKRSILDGAAVLDLPLVYLEKSKIFFVLNNQREFTFTYLPFHFLLTYVLTYLSFNLSFYLLEYLMLN